MGLFDIFSKKSAEEYYQEGEAFWNKEEYSEAYMCYCEAAKQRHSKAQYSLGYCLRRGIACQKDIPSAISWLEKAEKQGHVSAILELAYIYDDQEEIFYNKRKAIEYYTKAANMGNASAEFNLAFFYHSGDGVPQDIKKHVHYGNQRQTKDTKVQCITTKWLHTLKMIYKLLHWTIFMEETVHRLMFKKV